MRLNFKLLLISFWGSIAALHAQRFEWQDQFIDNQQSAYEVQKVLSHNNNVYVIGTFKNYTNIGDTTLVTNVNETNIYIANFDTLGNFRWAKQEGHYSNSETLRDAHLDRFGNIYIMGLFTDVTRWSGTNYNARGWNSGTKKEGFLVKLNASATTQWLKIIHKAQGWVTTDISFFHIKDNSIYFGGELNGELRLGHLVYVNSFQSVSQHFNDKEYYIARVDLNGITTLLETIIHGALNSDGSGIRVYGVNDNSYFLTGSFVRSFTFGKNLLPFTHGNGGTNTFAIAAFTDTTCNWVQNTHPTGNPWQTSVSGGANINKNNELNFRFYYTKPFTVFGDTLHIASNRMSLTAFGKVGFNGTLISMDTVYLQEAYSYPLYHFAQTDNGGIVIGGGARDSFKLADKTLITNGADDLLFVGLDSNLQLEWAQLAGGSNFDVLSDFHLSSTNSIYAISRFSSATTIGSTNYQLGPSNYGAVTYKIGECQTNSYPLTAIGDTNLCIGNTVQLQADSLFPSSFSWYKNNTLLNDSTSSLLITESGNYSVIVNGGGCIDTSRNVLVQIDSFPNLSFSMPDTICQQSSLIDLTVVSSPMGGVYSGIGVNGNIFNPTALTSGNTTVTFTYTNGGCSESIIDTLYVKAAPIVDFQVSNSFCISDSAESFTSLSPIGGSFSGVGISGNKFDPSLAGSGTFIISYTYDDGFGCVISTSKTIVVDTVASVGLALIPSFCSNNNQIVLNQGYPFGGKYIGTGIINDSLFDPSLAGSGNFNTSYIFANQCGIDTVSQSINVKQAPTVSFDSIFSVCEGSTPILLSGGLPSGGIYNGTAISTNQFDASIAGVGNFPILYNFIDTNGCSSTDSSVVIVHALPQVSITPDTTICNGASINLIANGGNRYLWNTGDTNSVLSVTPISTSIYSVNVRNANSCQRLDSVIITVKDYPQLAASNDTTICIGDTVQLIANSNHSNYLWSTNEHSSSIDVSPIQLTQYIVSSTNQGHCTSIDTVQVSVFANPILFLGNDTLLNNTSTTSISLDAGSVFSNYTWSDGSSQQTLTINYNSSKAGTTDTITVSVVSMDGCTITDTILIYHDFLTGIDYNQTTNNEINVFPNPVRDQLKIVSINKLNHIELYGMNSKLLLTTIGQEPSKNYTINTNAFSSGIYLLRVITAADTFTYKIIIN